jgi:hypothetical protein
MIHFDAKQQKSEAKTKVKQAKIMRKNRRETKIICIHYIIYITVKHDSAETPKNVIGSTIRTSQVRSFNYLLVALARFR